MEETENMIFALVNMKGHCCPECWGDVEDAGAGEVLCSAHIPSRPAFFKSDARIAYLSREVERLTAERDEALGLVRIAAEDSALVDDDGPGCFYCDRVTHKASCPAGKLLAAAKGAE